MTFEEVVFEIENKRRFGKACGREVTEELMELLGYPEAGMEIIHIAGTNGKGSVSAFVSSILKIHAKESGINFKVGTFTSPHLIDFTERIMVDGKQIPQADATRLGEMLLQQKTRLEPTMFDYCLAIALLYFKEQGVRYVVLETGLGGSKDSTAGLSTVPVVSAITSIGFDHTAILGNTLAEIAAEKAGIIKKGTSLVIGQMPSEASDVIVKKAQACDVLYTFADELNKDVKLGLFGAYQRKNAAVAVEIVRFLNLDIKEQTIFSGLEQACWRGRMEIVSKEPFVLVDGAHNPQGVKALKDSLVEAFKGEKFTFIMAVMADKDYKEMAELVKDISKRVYACSLEYSRALQCRELAEILTQKGFDAKYCDSYQEAIKAAKEYDEKIIVFGSLYFIGEVLKEY